MKEHRTLSPRQEALNERALYNAILTLKTKDELRAFFRDLCTPAEIQAMADRWAVASMLGERLPYRRIQQETGVSVTTVGRVAKFYQSGHGGYAIANARLAGGRRRAT
ncbi:MAG: YerC/YecD family TrpR-related protein [Steroidobacteraceae bacterium]